MKNSRFFITAGALALGVVGVFATKPAKKGTDFSVKFNTTDISGNFTANTTTYTITVGTNHKVQLKTVSNTVLSTLITISLNRAVYHL